MPLIRSLLSFVRPSPPSLSCLTHSVASGPFASRRIPVRRISRTAQQHLKYQPLYYAVIHSTCTQMICICQAQPHFDPFPIHICTYSFSVRLSPFATFGPPLRYSKCAPCLSLSLSLPLSSGQTWAECGMVRELTMFKHKQIMPGQGTGHTKNVL